MASIRRVGKKWLAEVRIKGAYSSKTFFSKPEAQSWAIEKERQIGKTGGALPQKTLADAALKYAKEVSPAKKGARWEIIRLERLAREPVSDSQLTDLTHDVLNDWMHGRLATGVKSSTVLREMNLLSTVLNTARVQWKWMTESPLRDVKRPKAPPARDVRINEDKINRILLALGYAEDAPVVTDRQRIAVAFLIALETAMRQGEIWGLEWPRIDMAGQCLALEDTKNGTRREVPLSTRAIELLKKLEPKKSGKLFLTPQASAGTIFRRALELAGIKGLTFHDARHEAITRLARKLEILDLARMVGHLDPRSLMIYYNPTASEIAKRLG